MTGNPDQLWEIDYYFMALVAFALDHGTGSVDVELEIWRSLMVDDCWTDGNAIGWLV